MSARPTNVGILAVEVYFPHHQVRAEDLEEYDHVSGKYTKGLEQVSLSFCDASEDTVTLALTCVHSLLEKYKIDPRRIGRLEVGSESNPDRSKSIKTHLMRLLTTAGNYDVEGVDTVQGCYGSTAALFNSANWIESTSWDGRLALAVAADVAAYAPGSPARATGGAGAVALLVGPNAPLVMDPAWRAHYSENSDDFCKPAGAGPFPIFTGPDTIHQYLTALDHCCVALHRRLQKLQQRLLELKAKGTVKIDAPFDLSNGLLSLVDFVAFHSPYAKLARKGLARLHLHDVVRMADGSKLSAMDLPVRWQACDPDALPGAGLQDKQLETALLTASRPLYELKVLPGAAVQQQVGNTYTASLYMALAGLWENMGPGLAGKRILLFAFGSGTQAALFSLVGRHVPFGGEFTLQDAATKLNLSSRLSLRLPMSPSQYDTILQQIAEEWGKVPATIAPELISGLPYGTWHLRLVDSNHVRHYARHTPVRTSPVPPSSMDMNEMSTGTSTLGTSDETIETKSMDLAVSTDNLMRTHTGGSRGSATGTDSTTATATGTSTGATGPAAVSNAVAASGSSGDAGDRKIPAQRLVASPLNTGTSAPVQKPESLLQSGNKAAASSLRPTAVGSLPGVAPNQHATAFMSPSGMVPIALIPQHEQHRHVVHASQKKQQHSDVQQAGVQAQTAHVGAQAAEMGMSSAGGVAFEAPAVAKQQVQRSRSSGNHKRQQRAQDSERMPTQVQLPLQFPVQHLDHGTASNLTREQQQPQQLRNVHGLGLPLSPAQSRPHRSHQQQHSNLFLLPEVEFTEVDLHFNAPMQAARGEDLFIQPSTTGTKDDEDIFTQFLDSARIGQPKFRAPGEKSKREDRSSESQAGRSIQDMLNDEVRDMSDILNDLSLQ